MDSLLDDKEIKLHAEQNLLSWSARKLRAGNQAKVKAIYIRGTKAPCTQCLPVLRAFGKALKDTYKADLHFEDDASGLATDVPQLARDGSNGQLREFDEFVKSYTAVLGASKDKKV